MLHPLSKYIIHEMRNYAMANTHFCKKHTKVNQYI
nr:MAG TPA: hypothetical protein [Caudoviricetes sp.]